jgi:hypothetical protein
MADLPITSDEGAQPVVGDTLPEVTAAWTSATAVNTALTVTTVGGYTGLLVTLNQGTTLTGGVVTFEVSDTTAFTNAYTVNAVQINGVSTVGTTYTLAASTNQAFYVNVRGAVAFRVRLSTVITGTGTVNVGIAANGLTGDPVIGGTVTANAGTGTFAENLTQVGGTSVTLGQKVSASSIPVVLASDQSGINTDLDKSGSGTVTALNGAVTTVTNGCSVIVFNVTGTWVATLTPEATVDGTNWFAINAYVPSSNSTIGELFSNSQIYVGCGGFAQVRLIATAFTSGTVAIAYDASSGNGALLQEIASNTAASSSDFQVTGTITALNGNVAVSGQGVYTVSVSITGTWVATLQAQGQLADGNWQQIPIYLVNTTLPYQPSFTITANGTYLITGGAYTNIRIIATAYTSGTVDISLDGSLAQQTIFAAQLGTWNVGVAQASTTSGQTGSLVQGAVTTNPPTYTTAQTNPLSLNVGGGLRTEQMLSTRQYYGVSTQAFTPPATPTDVATIIGSATKTIRVTRLELSTTQTTAGVNTWFIIVRSAADTGGTSATPTIVPLDSNNAAVTSVVRSYTANPTGLGAAVGTLRATRILSDATGTTAQTVYTFDFTNSGLSSGIVLRGVAQTLALNFGGAALPVGLSVSVNFEWSEE